MRLIEVVAGRAGVGKTRELLSRIAALCKSDPLGEPLILIVPDQYAFTAEKRLLQMSEGGAVTRVSVETFTRLAYRAKQLLGKANVPLVRGPGRHALIAAAYEVAYPSLTRLRRSNPTPQFLARIGKLIEECQTSLVDEDCVRRIGHAEQAELRGKLTDALQILDAYRHLIADKMTDRHDLLPLLAEGIKRRRLLVGAVFLDGFLGYTPQEFAILEQLFENSTQLTMTYSGPASYLTPRIESRTHASLAQAAETGGQLFRLLSRFSERGARVTDLDLPVINPPRFLKSPVLKNLEAVAFGEYERLFPSAKSDRASTSLMVIHAPHRRAEVEDVISRLLFLRESEDLAWSDLMLITTNPRDYASLLSTHLEEAKIPFFLDRRRPLLHHPLARAILSLLSLQEDSLASRALVGLLKTDLLPFTRAAVDAFENDWIETGVTVREWLAKERVSSRVPRSLYDFKRSLDSFVSSVSRGGVDAQTLVERMDQFLVEMRVFDLLAKRVEHDRAAGKRLDAQFHEQAATEIAQLFEDLTYAFGDSVKPLSEWETLIRAALATVHAGNVPPQADTLIITDPSRLRGNEAKHVCVLGCDDANFPPIHREDDVLSDLEREWLRTFGIFIGPSALKRQSFERDRFYALATRATDSAAFSYAQSDERGRKRSPGEYLRELKQALCADLIERDLGVLENAEWLAETTRFHSPAAMARQALLWMQNSSQRTFGETFEAELQQMGYAGLMLDLTHPRTAKSEQLARDLANRLYGTSLYVSVSRLERHAACAFAHFGSDGLKLQPRKTVDVDALLKGQFLHEVLHLYTTWQQAQDPFPAFEQAHAKMEEIIAAQMERQFPFAETASAATRLNRRQLRARLLRAHAALYEHDVRSAYKTAETEVLFDEGATLPPISIRLGDGELLKIRGRIDRIDLAFLGERMYFRVIDYKSRPRAVDLLRMYLGLSLQLPVYAHVIEAASEALFHAPSQFAGMYYVPVYDPLSELKRDEEAALSLRKPIRFRGLGLANRDVLQLLDRNLPAAKDLFPQMLTKTGIHTNAMVVSAEVWRALREHTLKKASELARSMVDGVTAIAPYQLKQERACQNCNLQSVCQFEAHFDERQMRVFKSIAKDDVIAQLNVVALDVREVQ